MRKLVLPIALMVGLVSCKQTKEDTCKCLQQSANEYMLKGIKPTVEDLSMTCKIDKDDYDPKEKAAVAACAQEVMENVNSKTLIPIDGKQNLVFPSYEFGTIDEFVSAVNKAQDGGYKYYKTTITIKDAYAKYKPEYLNNGDASLSVYTYDEAHSLLLFGKPNDFDSSKFALKSGITTSYDYNIVWDTKEQKINTYKELKWILLDADDKNPQDFISEAMDNQTAIYKYKDVSMTMYEKYLAVVIERLMATEEYKNLIADLANGRYKLVDKDELPVVDRTQLSFTGVYIPTSIEAYGTQVSSWNIMDAKIFNIKPVGLPASLTGKGKAIDIKKYLLSSSKNTVSSVGTPQKATGSSGGRVIVSKAYFYHEADLSTKRKGYLIKGQSVTVGEIKGDFIYCVYQTDQGKTDGWMLKSDIQN